MNLRESATYQGILEGGDIGLEKGRVEGAQRALRIAGEKRFGPPDAATQMALNNITSVETLDRLLLRALEVESWQELLA